MGIFSKLSIFAILIILIIVIIYLLSNNTQTQQTTQSQAISSIYNSLLSKDPSVQINITNVSQSQYPNNWDILANVTYNATSPCPSYFSYLFNYPKNGTNYIIKNIYTKNCKIYANPNSPYINDSQIAITRAYNLNIPSITSFINNYGFSSVKVNATYYKNLIYNKIYYPNVWLINYFAVNSSPTAILISQKNGTAYGEKNVSLDVSLIFPQGVYNLNLNVRNSQINLSKNVQFVFDGQNVSYNQSTGYNCSGRSYPLSASNNSSNIGNNTNISGNNSTTYAICEKSISGLMPFNTYNVSVIGTMAPYCPQGSICPNIMENINKYAITKTFNYGGTSYVYFHLP